MTDRNVAWRAMLPISATSRNINRTSSMRSVSPDIMPHHPIFRWSDILPLSSEQLSDFHFEFKALLMAPTNLPPLGSADYLELKKTNQFPEISPRSDIYQNIGMPLKASVPTSCCQKSNRHAFAPSDFLLPFNCPTAIDFTDANIPDGEMTICK